MPIGLLEVDGEALLVSVQLYERALPVPGIFALLAPEVIARSRRSRSASASHRSFDLHDVGAEIAEDARAERPCPDMGQIKDANACQRLRTLRHRSSLTRARWIAPSDSAGSCGSDGFPIAPAGTLVTESETQRRYADSVNRAPELTLREVRVRQDFVQILEGTRGNARQFPQALNLSPGLLPQCLEYDLVQRVLVFVARGASGESGIVLEVRPFQHPGKRTPEARRRGDVKPSVRAREQVGGIQDAVVGPMARAHLPAARPHHRRHLRQRQQCLQHADVDRTSRRCAGFPDGVQTGGSGNIPILSRLVLGVMAGQRQRCGFRVSHQVRVSAHGEQDGSAGMPLTPRAGHAKRRDGDANAIERLPAQGFELIRHTFRNHHVRVRREPAKCRGIREAHTPLPRVQENLRGALRHPGVRYWRNRAIDTYDFGARMDKQAATEPRRESP